MPIYQKAGPEILEMADELISEFDGAYRLLNDVKIKIDFLVAFGDRDEKTNELTNHALTKNGIRAYGICRVVSLKDRVKGMGDVEISLDGDHWAKINKSEQRAILDHEMHHIIVREKKGNILFDDIGRPKIRMREHDAEFGWFKIIAERHGLASIERKQAKMLVEYAGQFFFPEFENFPQLKK